MPDTLAEIWARADANEARFDADEIARWPEGREARLVEAGIIRRDDNARTVTCDACQDGHVEEVVRIEDPPGSPVRAYIPCPELGRVTVPLERLKQWVVDFEGLVGEVARALDFVDAPDEIVRGRLWKLGTSTVDDTAHEVLFARGMFWHDAPTIVGPLLRVSKNPVLLVASGILASDTWADSHPVISLAEICRLESGRLAVDQDRFRRLLIAAKEPRRKANSRSALVLKPGRPALTVEKARRRLLGAIMRLRSTSPQTDRLTNVALARAFGVSPETIGSWLALAKWNLEELEVEWSRRERSRAARRPSSP